MTLENISGPEGVNDAEIIRYARHSKIWLCSTRAIELLRSKLLILATGLTGKNSGTGRRSPPLTSSSLLILAYSFGISRAQLSAVLDSRST